MKVLKPQEVAAMLRISVPQLCRLTKARKIPAKDLGTGRNHCWRYDEAQLEKWITERQPAPDSTIKTRRRKQAVHSDLNGHSNNSQSQSSETIRNEQNENFSPNH